MMGGSEGGAVACMRSSNRDAIRRKRIRKRRIIRGEGRGEAPNVAHRKP